MFKNFKVNEKNNITTVEESAYKKIKIPTVIGGYTSHSSDDDCEERTCLDCAYMTTDKGKHYCDITLLPLDSLIQGLSLAEDCTDFNLL
jgi:hypothetical protein